MKCVYCGGNHCSCWWQRKCTCTKQYRQRNIHKILKLLWYTTNQILPQNQDDKCKEIITYIKEQYPNSIDTKEVLNHFNYDDKKKERVENRVCEFINWLPNDLCKYCNRPKWHVDKFGGLCS